MTRKTRAQICDSVKRFRDECSQYGFIGNNGQINLSQVLEFLEHIWKDWDYVVLENEEMGNLLGKASPSIKRITLRLDVYEGLANGDPEHCFTVAHELGHMVMHSEFEFARRESMEQEFIDSMHVEQEADLFAEELLGFNSPFVQGIEIEVLKILEEIKNMKEK